MNNQSGQSPQWPKPPGQPPNWYPPGQGWGSPHPLQSPYSGQWQYPVPPNSQYRPQQPNTSYPPKPQYPPRWTPPQVPPQYYQQFQQPPPSGKAALPFGALFGLCLSLLQITLDKFLGTPNFTLDFWLCVPAFLLAGLFAAKRTGKVGTGALAGLWAGFIGSLNYWTWPLIFSFSTVFATRYAALIGAGFILVLILTSAVQVAIGSGLGALGGLLGRRLSPMAQRPSSPYPPASWPAQASQEFSYQSSPPPLPHNVYHLRPLWRVFYLGIYPLISLVVGLSLASKYLDTSGSSVFSLFFICLLVLAIGYNISYGIRMSMARLVTSPAGVTYYGVGFRIYVPWHQIASIGKVWKRWRGIPWMAITGFTFRTPPARVQSANQALQEQVPVIEISLWRRPFYRRYTKLIPLTWFVGNLQNSALGRDIRWSAPHLLGGMPSASISKGENRIPEMQEEAARVHLTEEERHREAQEVPVQPAAGTIPLSVPPIGQPAREGGGIPTVQLRPRWRKVPFSMLVAALLVIASGVLSYATIPYQISRNQAPATATESAQAPATVTVSAQAPNPYGGKLVISDPMSGPGSAFGWDVGDVGGQCNFKNGAYHVSGVECYGYPSLSTKFAFEIHLTAGHNCGDLEFLSHSSVLTSAEVIVCQDGYYDLRANSEVTGTAPAMHTGTNQSNTIGIVSDGTHIILFINYVRVASTPGVYTDLNAIILNGYGPHGSSSLFGEVVYSDARLWSF